MDNITVSIDRLERLIIPPLKARYPVCISGPHGFGKSEFVHSLENTLPKALELDIPKMQVVERRISQMSDIGDAIGMPRIKNNTTVFTPTDWFKRALDEPCILYLDEFDRGQMDVAQGFFEIADSRKMYGQRLHPDTVVIATVNGSPGNHHYQTRDFDPAELNRWVVFYLEASVEAWIKWARVNSVNPLITEFILKHKEHLAHPGPFSANVVYPSPRSWVRLSHMIAKNGLLKDENTTEELFDLFYLAHGIVGYAAALEFKNYITANVRPINIYNIVVDNFDEPFIESMSLNEHSLFGRKYLLEDKLTNELLTPERIGNMAHYLRIAPKEPAAMLMKAICEKNMENGVKMGEVKVHNDERNLSAYFINIMGIQMPTDEEEEESVKESVESLEVKQS